MTAFKISIISVLIFFNTNSYAQDENLSPKWKELFSKYSDIQQLCMKKGLEFYKLKIISMDPNAQLVEPNDAKVKPIYETCEKFLAKKLRVEQPCNMKNSDGSSNKSVCSDVYIVEKDGKKLRTTVDRAIVHTFEGLPLSIAFIELKEAAESRVKAEEQTREKARLEEETRIAEEKRIEEYKKSPAYKKELADLAMKKALEDAKNKNDQAEQEKKYISDLTKIVECNTALYTKGFVIQDKATNDADKIPGVRIMKIAEIWINYVGAKFGSQRTKEMKESIDSIKYMRMANQQAAALDSFIDGCSTGDAGYKYAMAEIQKLDEKVRANNQQAPARTYCAVGPFGMVGCNLSASQCQQTIAGMSGFYCR